MCPSLLLDQKTVFYTAGFVVLDTPSNRIDERKYQSERKHVSELGVAL